MDMTQLNDYTTRSEAVCRRNDTISPRLYEEYGVKKGLRDENGNGVLAGLTNISKITSSKIVDGKKVPCDGQLWYRGYRVEDLIGSLGETELGYEKIAYLLLMGQMPDSAAAEEFRRLLGECRTLPTNFTRDVIMKAPGKDIMNSMTRGILTLASYDERAIDTSVSNSLRQGIPLLAIMDECDIVRDIQSGAGLWVRNGESERLAKAIRFLRDNPEKARDMRRKCRELYLQKYTTEICTGKYVSLFRELLHPETGEENEL